MKTWVKTETRFKEGQRVRALITGQGLVEGTNYTIVDMETWPTAFGCFVHYALQETPSHKAVVVANGHLLLEEVA
jgi:hypothetical protein